MAREDLFFVIDLTLLAVFGLEYLVRLMVYHRPWEFWMIWVEVCPSSPLTHIQCPRALLPYSPARPPAPRLRFARQ